MLFLLSSCEDVIDVDLQTSRERLVIEALIKVKKGANRNNQTIKLSKTTSFYNTKFTPATRANVSIINENGDAIQFTENRPGIYTTTNFKAVPNTKYSLKIEYNKQVYSATETYKTVPSITKITQTELTKAEKEAGLKIPEVKLEFNDVKNIKNFYRINMRIFESNASRYKTNNNETFSDEYVDGQKIEVSFTEDDLKENDKFIFTLYGISEKFVDYLDLISAQSESVGGGLFGSPPSNVKGNCINETNNENYPYGYFSLSEYDTKEYIYKYKKE